MHTILAVGPSQGGVAHAFSGTIAALRGRGWTVLDEQLRESGSAALGALRLLWKRRRAVRTADSVHVEFGSNDLAPFWFALFAAALRRDVVVVTHDPPRIVHAPGAGLIRRDGAWRLRVAYRILSPVFDRAILRTMLRRAGAIVVLGQTARAELQAHTDRPVVFAPHGSLASSASSLPPSSCDYVLFAGFLGPNKGLDLLIEAWAMMEQHPLRLVIAGASGPDQKAWLRGVRDQAARLDRPPEWLGSVEAEADFQRLFDHAAIVVLPYRASSPASGILVRAMSAGRCVVAARVAATVPVMEHEQTGVLFDVGDARALARELSRFSADGAGRDRLGAAASRRASEVFDWNSFVDGLQDAYEVARRDTQRL
jgi:glycosyltransferase involved in cell wall biosynthesis